MKQRNYLLEDIKKVSSEENKGHRSIAIFLLACCTLFLCAAALFEWNSINSYVSYNTETMHYVKAQVVRIEKETLEYSREDQRYLGTQTLTVQLMEGNEKGEEIEIDNYLTRIHNIHVSQGSRIIVCADTPQDAAPYYTVFNYDRSISLLALIIVFFIVMVLIGKKKGIYSLLGMAFTLLIVVLFMVQAIYHGWQPVLVTVLTILLSAIVTLVLLNGAGEKTRVSFLSTLAGVCVTGILFAIFSAFLHLSGYNMDTAETLLMVGEATGLSIQSLLLCSVLISALGAVMDVAVSLSAAMAELIAVQPDISRSALVHCGLNIGKDMIGTMSNTLILAYTGTALNTMLCLIAYGYQVNQLLNSDYLTIELVQALCATIGINWVRRCTGC